MPGASASRSIEGRVVRIERAPEDELAQNVRITVAVDSGEGEVSVDLAPGWVLDQRGVHLKQEDAVQIEARSVAGGLEATAVRGSGPRVVLRGEDGKPLWLAPAEKSQPKPSPTPSPE